MIWPELPLTFVFCQDELPFTIIIVGFTKSFGLTSPFPWNWKLEVQPWNERWGPYEEHMRNSLVGMQLSEIYGAITESETEANRQLQRRQAARYYPTWWSYVIQSRPPPQGSSSRSRGTNPASTHWNI